MVTWYTQTHHMKGRRNTRQTSITKDSGTGFVAKLVSASIKEVHFDPDQDEPMMSRTVLVSAMRQTSGGMVSAKKVGDVTSSMLDDRSN